MDDDIDIKEASCSFVTPLAVMAMAEECKKNGFKSVIHTVACSNIGKLMYKYFRSEGIKVIGIVRRYEQVEILKRECGEDVIVINSQDYNWEE